jgi:PAS domain S-box-containing protein
MTIKNLENRNWDSGSPEFEAHLTPDSLYRALLNSTSSAILLVQDERIVFANPAVKTYLNTELTTVSGLKLCELFHSDDRNRIEKICSNLDNNQITENGVELRLLRAEDDYLWVECNLNILEFQDKPAALITLTDITPRKKLAQTGTALEAILLASIEQSSAGIMIVDYPETIVRSANRAAIRLRGYDDDYNPVGQPLLDFSKQCSFFRSDEVLYTSRDYPLFRAMATGESVKNEEMIVERKDGSREWVLTQAEPVKNDSGEIIAGIILTSDITERKQAEESIQQLVEDLKRVKNDLEQQNRDLQQAENRINSSLDQYTDLYENAPVGYLTISPRSVVLRANSTACKILRIDHTSLMRRSLLNLVVNRHMTTLADHFASVADHKRRLSCEIELKGEDGDQRFVRFESVPTPSQDGTIQLRSALVDISQRMKAEIKLAQSEQRYRMIVESPLSVVGVLDDTYSLSFANQGFCDLVKYPHRKLIGMDFRQLLTDEKREMIVERYERRRQGESVPRQYEIDLVAKDGTIHSVIANIFLATGPEGKLQTVFNAVDITDRKQAQAKLSQVEKQFEKLFEQSIDAVYVRKSDRFILVNPSFEKLFGYTTEELYKSDFDTSSLVAIHDRQRVAERLKNFEDGQKVDPILNFAGCDSSGKHLVLQTTSSVIEWEGSAAILGFIRDLTDQQIMTIQVE